MYTVWGTWGFMWGAGYMGCVGAYIGWRCMGYIYVGVLGGVGMYRVCGGLDRVEMYGVHVCGGFRWGGDVWSVWGFRLDRG